MRDIKLYYVAILQVTLFVKSICQSIPLSVNLWKVPIKGKGVNLYSASRVHASNALFITNQSRRPHSHRVRPADTGWRSGRPGSPSQLY